MKCAIRDLEQAIAELRDNVSNWRDLNRELPVILGEMAKNLQILDRDVMNASSRLKSFAKIK